jgi:hypothetical protein
MSTHKQHITPAATGHCFAQSLASGANTPGSAGWYLPISCRALLITCQTATLSAGTATYKLQVADDTNGTNAADLTGYTSLAVHSAAKSLTVAEVPVGAITKGKYVAVVCTTESGTGICSAIIHRVDADVPA